MIDVLLRAGSFAAIWLTSWLFLFLVLASLYPLLRSMLLRCHPATASNLVLTLLSFPFLASLLASVLLFTPYLAINPFSNHVHSVDCDEQFAALHSPWVVGCALGIAAITLGLMLLRMLRHMAATMRLKKQLLMLAEPGGEWHLLPNKEKLVFTLGWLKNSIFITDGLLRECSSAELDIILKHEQAHMKRKDNLRMLMARVLLMLFPPALARPFQDDLHLFAEAACDYSSVAGHDPLDVAETLLRMQRLMPDRVQCFNHTISSAYVGTEVENRVKLLLAGTSFKRRLRIPPIVYLITLVILSLLLVDPLHHGMEWLWRSN